MADRHRLDARALLTSWEGWISLLVIVAGCLATGAGPVNGDIAVYLNQVTDGEIFERPTHAGFVMIFMMFRQFPLELQWTSDLLSALCAAVAVVTFASAAPKNRALVAALIAGWVLPWSGFGEVDPVWFALCGLGLHGGPVFGALCLAAAVSISPAALVMVPWIAWWRGDRRWVGAVGAVVLLTLGTSGAWWWGLRGVGLGWSPAPGRWLGWLVPALLLCGRRFPWPALLVIPALLAPGDLPGHWLLGVPVLFHAVPVWHRPRVGALVGATVVLVGLVLLVEKRERVAAENAAIARVVSHLEPGDALIGPWSWRVRVSLAATGSDQGLSEGCDSKRIWIAPGRLETAGTPEFDVACAQ